MNVYFYFSGLMEFKLGTYPAILTIVLLAVMLIIAGYVTYYVSNRLLNGNFAFDESFLYACFLTYPVLQIVPVICLIKAPSLAEYLNEWQQFHVSRCLHLLTYHNNVQVYNMPIQILQYAHGRGTKISTSCY